MTMPRNRFFQVAWVVNDLDAAIRHWVENVRVGPFFKIPHVQVSDFRYRGTPGTLDFSGALAQSGPMQIELIEQHSDGPSAYRDTFAPGEEGFHHMCTLVEDYDAEIAHYASQGIVPSVEACFGDMRFAYLDSRATLGHMIEIVEDLPSIRELFKVVADAAEGWDGKDPVRVL